METSVANDERPGRGMAAVGTAAFGFSFGFILVKLVGLPGPTLAGARLLIGAAAVVGAALLWRRPRPVRWPPVLAAGLPIALYVVSLGLGALDSVAQVRAP